ncbi:tRNA uridine-5-carboxymethylaminomethyl(34) synthesis GTPase MnmE [Paenibacillus tarimensis]|uniref:tRNA uridine-5-carboxymethylaminomethyl(34) synthesis GTPase MnmE n=1 Tax=Paenibacillus tarimensis TaxID=416012 RepID=UPI001F40D4C1|nr:tRNA uridine-5-carboxymethylaminomethyl(34) synthesis GTPase MnmE [Paenibacillus tarimensis]MCF2944538.1 tRNA uridine-5-carboxymethylaminomethyl(34) synthesis GTPase MnmE [Paenibacillus tarimensis]
MNMDTIAAISTAVGESGIAVIRVSGADAVKATAPLFRSRVDLNEAATHTVNYGHIIDPDTGEVMEESLVTVMRGPRSFTAEDVVEISTHGGIVAVKRVMELLLRRGTIRLAEPGEFTKRAFLNGRIDLTQAEAVMDLIRSKSDRAFSIALKQAEGSLSKKIKLLRHQLIELLAHIEVNIDYPEHDVTEMSNAFIRDQSMEVIAEIIQLLRTASEGKILREGIVTAIVGRPNVGKSSLLNALSQSNKAIVTDIPGTTRDVIEEFVTVKGIPLRLLDTAGIRETSDLVERIGVERSRTALGEADLIMLVLNNAEPLHEDEKELLKQLSGRQMIVILNKTDLPTQLSDEELIELVPEQAIVRMSVAEERGMDQLEEAIASMFFSGKLESADMTYVSNVRHIALLKQAMRSLEDAIEATESGIPIDIVQIDVRTAWELLGEITGDSAGDSLIDQIFSQFCLGK